MALSDPPVVLVVEDEPLLRFFAVELIEGAGFTVIEASNADDALVSLHQRTDIRVVLTDIDMPGSMNGLQFAAAVRDRWPPVEIILTSGKTAPAERPSRSLFFEKPYDEDKLVQAIRNFIEQGD